MRKTVLFRIARIPKGVETSRPGCNPTFVREADDPEGAENTHANDGGVEQALELFRRDMCTHKLRKCDDL